MDKGNSERDKESNQQSDFPNWGSEWRWTCNSMHGYVQGEDSIWWKSWQVKLIILVRGDLKNKELFGDTWSPTASMRTLKYFLADAAKHKARVNQLYFIGELLQAKVNNIVFVKLDIRYTYYFP